MLAQLKAIAAGIRSLPQRPEGAAATIFFFTPSFPIKAMDFLLSLGYQSFGRIYVEVGTL